MLVVLPLILHGDYEIETKRLRALLIRRSNSANSVDNAMVLIPTLWQAKPSRA